MFWKKDNSPKNEVLKAWWVLPWQRLAADHTDWRELDLKRSFKQYFDSQKYGLIEFESEWTVVPTQSELDRVFEVIWKKSDQLAKQFVDQAQFTLPSRLVLQYSPVGLDAYRLHPFLAPTVREPKMFHKVRPIQLDLALNLVFADPEISRERFVEKKQVWRNQLEVDVLDQFLLQESFRELKARIHEQSHLTAFASLLTLLNQFDHEVQSISKLTSFEYLKRVWSVPHFVYAEEPEQGMMTVLRIQRSYSRIRQQLFTELVPYYLAEYLSWKLLNRFDTSERAELSVFLLKTNHQQQSELCDTILYPLYRRILEGCGVPVELSHLFGSEVYLERALSAIARLSSKNQEVYTLLLEEVVRTCIRHSDQLTNSPEELFLVLVKCIVRRLSEFQAHRIATQREVQDLL